MNDDHKSIYFLGEGMPTGPDVEMICKAYPDAAPGTKLLRDDLYKLLGLDPANVQHQRRLNTIMNAYKSRMFRDHARPVIYDKAIAGWLIATPADVIAKSPEVTAAIRRKARRQRRNLAAVERQATDSDRVVIQHQARVFEVMEREARKSSMNLLPNTAAPTAPQITPPVKRKNGDA